MQDRQDLCKITYIDGAVLQFLIFIKLFDIFMTRSTKVVRSYNESVAPVFSQFIVETVVFYIEVYLNFEQIFLFYNIMSSII
jgi:hypothetical protein